MPKVPKWMADAMQSLFSGMYHPVQVTATEELEERLRRVRFEGDFSGSKRAFVPGNVIEFRVSDTEFRHYTPSYFDPKAGVCEVLFYLHGKGPGSKWVADLKVGETLNLLGPGGKIGYNASSQNHIAFGDETSLGSFACIEAEAKQQRHSFYSIAELDKENKHWPKALQLETTVVEKDKEMKAIETIRYLDGYLANYSREKASTTFYLTGNAKSISGVKKFLISRGFESKQIRTEPYWSEGKTGL
ncbi:NADPH-dependent ferric siderophore reductase [Algoriphagus sp. 4150]|uniref:siderophore-interacting protein n=1 Tax=Algoriphagus sp. 4150 TaxID=2817756 RepID=UPI00285FF9E4|nr:siderophore-interacting protein [Algoriphagus sp. 4150]MDR7129564.1 NADPH-dependent ferric siderophore reductase [Algoriphagus sp. 4150]